MKRDHIALYLYGGQVQTVLGLERLAGWVSMSEADLRAFLLSIAGAAATGYHASAPAPRPESEDDSADEALVELARRRVKAKANG